MELQTTQNIPVKSLAELHSLPTSFIQSLPEIVRDEILEPPAKVATSEQRQAIVARLISLLDVKFENEQAKGLAITEFKSFIRDYRLTGREIISAYKMAVKEQLLDAGGNRIEVYPNLSIITAGKIFNAYENFKAENALHTSGREKIKNFLNPPPPEPTEDEKRMQRARLIREVEECILERGNCEFAFLIYEDIQTDPDFQVLRKTFPETYDNQFRRWIEKQKASERAFFTKHELEQKERRHGEIMPRLIIGKVKKNELEGAPYQLAKNELIEKFYADRRTRKKGA